MHPYIGEHISYALFNSIGYYVILVASVLLFTIRRKNPGICTSLLKYGLSSRFNDKVGTVAEFLLISCESLIVAYLTDVAGFANRPFGALVGTGANYYATLLVAPILISVVSLLFVSNPLKQVNFIALLLPLRLIFIRLACYCNGCCWGISWEHGPYNHNIFHPGNQVPVQAIESFCSLVILIFLVWYMRKKTHTLYPMYLMLYSSTRFFIEFFTAGYPDILGPFNMNQITSVIAFVVGVVFFFILSKSGDKISDLLDKPQKVVMSKITKQRDNKLAKEKAEQEAERLARLEKAKAARAKAKATKRK